MSDDLQHLFIELDTSLGRIKGQIVISPCGKQIAKFLGIPYAQQPVGALRFKALQPLNLPLGTKESPYSALAYGKSSIQKLNIPYSTQNPTGEDCIWLNIFAPLENIDKPQRRVFFHIHGGGFIRCSGSESIFDLVNFVARHDCVGVSINYRLGVLGFLSMPPVIEDNLGLKDQQVALRWVHEHVRSFGGDPNQITLYGCSAGGVSCHYHCVNRESIDLFDRAIISSGVINPRWASVTPAQQKKRVALTLKELKCPKNQTQEEILQFLLSLDVSEFGRILREPAGAIENEPRPVNTFMENPKRLVPLKQKPILIGVAEEEGNFFLVVFLANKSTGAGLTKTRKLWANLLGEIFFFEPFRQTLRQITSERNDYPLFVYKFDYETETRGPGLFDPSVFPPQIGKVHALDALFFLNQVCRNSPHVSNPTETDIAVNSTMTETVEKFMTQDVDKMGAELSIYSAENPKILRIRPEGIDSIDCNFKTSASRFTAMKLLYSTLMVKLFPNRI